MSRTRPTPADFPSKYRDQIASQLYGSAKDPYELVIAEKAGAAADRGEASGALAKQAIHDAADRSPRREAAYPGRVRIRVESVRKRLLDPDNLVPKYFIDCCRYSGLISGDSPTEVEIVTTQRLPAKGEEEHTLIEMEPIR